MDGAQHLPSDRRLVEPKGHRQRDDGAGEPRREPDAVLLGCHQQRAPPAQPLSVSASISRGVNT